MVQLSGPGARPGLWPFGNPRFAQLVRVVSAESAERLVGRAVEVRRGGRNEVELLAELQTMGRLRPRVWWVEGLDPVQADVADEALHQVADLRRLAHVPLGGRAAGPAAGRVDQLDGPLGAWPAAR